MRVTGPVQLISTATCPSVLEREQIRSRVDWSIYSHFQLVPLKPACPNSTQSFSSLSHFHLLQSTSFCSFHSLSFPLPAALARPHWFLFPFLVAFPYVRHVYPNLYFFDTPPHHTAIASPPPLHYHSVGPSRSRLHDLRRPAIRNPGPDPNEIAPTAARFSRIDQLEDPSTLIFRSAAVDSS